MEQKMGEFASSFTNLLDSHKEKADVISCLMDKVVDLEDTVDASAIISKSEVFQKR